MEFNFNMHPDISDERLAELNRTTIDIKYLDSIPAYPTSPACSLAQAKALAYVCVVLGLYDADDFIQSSLRHFPKDDGEHVSIGDILTEDYYAKRYPQVQSVLTDQLEAAYLISYRFGLEKAGIIIKQLLD